VVNARLPSGERDSPCPPRTVLDIVESHVDEELIESVVADALTTGAVTKARLERRFHELSDAARARAERVFSAIGS